MWLNFGRDIDPFPMISMSTVLSQEFVGLVNDCNIYKKVRPLFDFAASERYEAVKTQIDVEP